MGNSARRMPLECWYYTCFNRIGIVSVKCQYVSMLRQFVFLEGEGGGGRIPLIPLTVPLRPRPCLYNL